MRKDGFLKWNMIRKKILVLFLCRFWVRAWKCSPGLATSLSFIFSAAMPTAALTQCKMQCRKSNLPSIPTFFMAALISLPRPSGISIPICNLPATSKETFNFRSAAWQARYLWLDDIVGDPISFATGASVRVTSTTSLKDVSCPYHGNVDFEVNFALGKEWDVFGMLAFPRLGLWRCRPCQSRLPLG